MASDNWSFEEFSTFVMLYAASIDTQIEAKEEQLIQEITGNENYNAVKDVFEKSNDAEVLDIIFSYKDQYLHPEEYKNRIFAQLRKVFEADQKYDVIEQHLMHMLTDIAS